MTGPAEVVSKVLAAADEHHQFRPDLSSADHNRGIVCSGGDVAVAAFTHSLTIANQLCICVCFLIEFNQIEKIIIMKHSVDPNALDCSTHNKLP